MTVGDLMCELEQFDEDTEVCIGMFQYPYGTNFTMEISQIDLYGIDNWDDIEDNQRVILVEGRQFGSINDDNE